MVSVPSVVKILLLGSVTSAAASLNEGDQALPDAKQHAAEIVRKLREHGHQAYFAGGCVRDLLLSREPADYDVATDATPRQVMQVFPRPTPSANNLESCSFPSMLTPQRTRRNTKATNLREQTPSRVESCRA